MLETFRQRLRTLKYNIADWLFEAELDDAYAMGFREGTRSSLAKVAVDLKKHSNNITKGEQKLLVSSKRLKPRFTRALRLSLAQFSRANRLLEYLVILNVCQVVLIGVILAKIRD